MTDDLDLRLRDLLSPASRAPDQIFADRVQRAVLAEQRFAAVRRQAWRRFAAEAAATAAAAAAFFLLGRIGAPPEGAEMVPLMGPAMVGILMLGLWVGLGLKPAGGSSAMG